MASAAGALATAGAWNGRKSTSVVIPHAFQRPYLQFPNCEDEQRREDLLRRVR